MEDKLIIFAALGYPQKADPNLPAIPANWEEVVESAVAARKAGASIVHLHGPVDDEGRTIPDGWARITEEIRKRCDVLIDFGRASSPLEERKTLLRLGTGKPDFRGICLSEHDYLYMRGVRDVKFVHTRAELEEYARCCLETGVKPCWEVQHLGGIWNFNHLVSQRLVTKPYWLELIFGTEGGTWSPPTIDEIGHRIDNLPADSVYLVAPRGTAGPIGQTRMSAYVIIRGGHLRLGGQDIPYYTDGVPAKSNAQLIERIVRIANDLGREIATPADTRKILGMNSAAK